MSEKETDFTTMAGPKGSENIPQIGIGMLGYAFMGKAHTNADKTLPYMMYPPPAIPNLVAIAGNNAEGVQEAAKRYGYANAYADWHKLLENEKVQLFDNCGPRRCWRKYLMNNHRSSNAVTKFVINPAI